MSDLVKRLRTSWDDDRSIISQTDSWMKERQEAADRIEELEAKARENFQMYVDANEARIDAEAQLEKAVEALVFTLSEYDAPNDMQDAMDKVRTTLAELKGDNNG